MRGGIKGGLMSLTLWITIEEILNVQRENVHLERDCIFLNFYKDKLLLYTHRSINPSRPAKCRCRLWTPIRASHCQLVVTSVLLRTFLKIKKLLSECRGRAWGDNLLIQSFCDLLVDIETFSWYKWMNRIVFKDLESTMWVIRSKYMRVSRHSRTNMICFLQISLAFGYIRI